jgi:hypothetical protein
LISTSSTRTGSASTFSSAFVSLISTRPSAPSAVSSPSTFRSFPDVGKLGAGATSCERRRTTRSPCCSTRRTGRRASAVNGFAAFFRLVVIGFLFG